ncbi:ABC transporter permease subunit [Bacillus sp. FJAT-50079]|uniref:ABC transporter permease n=1 Tax=Bacillus sp. FJAT-50079 TaxID=2833577 RepID=UPI001BC8E0E8|nr:ABC transporter permease subunit [Bacillus sp. FJAT-50079]MBS4208673.1 sugar ABC transporter permease [Bacillus sp. FJAT-50079]
MSYRKKDTLQRKVPLAIQIKNNSSLYLMMLPGVVALVIFSYVPMYGVIMAFQDFNVFDGYFGSQWVGFKHFKALFADPYFLKLLRNTFLLGFLTFIFAFPAPILLALMINESKFRKFKGIVQSISYLPHFIPMVVMVGIMYVFFGSYGIVNSIISFLGLDSISFFSSPEWFRSLYIGSAIWKGIGWGSIIYIGALSAIDPSMYEAASVDGANRWHKIWHITLPGLKPTIVTLFILDVAGVMKVGFEKVFLMYSPATYEVADVLSTYVYRQGILDANYSYSAAVDLFNNIIALIFLLAANKLAKKLGEDGIV